MMNNRAVISILALATAASACSRPVSTAPVPAPGTVPGRTVERAALPPANPSLPAVPDVRGPLSINVVYPKPDQLIQSRDSNFIFGSVGSGDAGLKINGILVPVWPNGAFFGWLPLPSNQAPFYDMVATNGLDSARLNLPIRLLPPPVRDTIRPDTTVVDTTQRTTVVAKDTTPPPLQYALINPASTANDTDRVAIARPAPGEGQQYKWFLFPNTPVKVTGTKGDFMRIELDSAAPVWIQKTDVVIQPVGYTPPARVIGAAARVEIAPEWIDLVIPTNTPPPYLVEESDRSISVLLYGSTSETVVSALPMPADKYVAGVSVSTEPGRVRYTVSLNRAPYGYLAMYQNGALIFRVRRPPVIADANNPLRGLTITVDPGHPPAGTTGPTAFYEGEAVLAVGLKLRDLLLQKGVNVVMTRTTMDPVELGLRPIISRRANANAFVSLHLDAEPDGVNPMTHAATACYYFWPHSTSFAQQTIANLGPAMGTPILGSKYQNFAVMRGTWMPSILCEGGFLILPDVEAAYRTPAYQERFARGIVAGLESYFASLARAQ